MRFTTIRQCVCEESLTVYHTRSLSHSFWALGFDTAAGQTAAFTVDLEQEEKANLSGRCGLFYFYHREKRRFPSSRRRKEAKACPTLWWGETPANRVYKTWWGMWSIRFSVRVAGSCLFRRERIGLIFKHHTNTYSHFTHSVLHSFSASVNKQDMWGFPLKLWSMTEGETSVFHISTSR